MKLINFIVFLLFLNLLLPFRVIAQDLPVPLISVACDNVADLSTREFHSLRPFQANSRCQTETVDYASFCGNNLTLKETVSITYNSDKDTCTPMAGSKIRCNYISSISNKLITIDLSGANLPIMGNTEDVINYKVNLDKLSNAEKVNEYVSWYLNGITNKKEYPEKLDSSSFVNYSGPISKLLPQEIQLAERINTIERAVGEDVNKDEKQPGQNRHDQFVVCTNEIDIPILDTTIPLGKTKPADCSVFLEKYSLKDWSKERGWVDFRNGIIEKLKGEIGNLDEILPNIPGVNFIETILRDSTVWAKHVPPLSWQDEYKDDPILYKKHYNEWRGKSCIITPFPKILVCVENIFVPNKWADLFTYVPLSSTEDLEGNIKIDSFSATSDAKIANVKFSNQSPAPLFFAHIQESDELATLLQNTFVAGGEEKTGSNVAVEPSISCTTVDVRSNKGDNLFAKSLTGFLSYTASFNCDFDSRKTSPQTCSKDVFIVLTTTSNTPKINDVWSRLVAGPTAVVKRMFPKLGTQIGTLSDIPGSTKINYSGAGAPSGQLNLPHIGGVSEYFLKGIQTLLRPKGYGEIISFGEVTEEPETSGEIDCDQSAPDISLPNTISKEDLHEVAIRWQGREGDRVLECYNDVARKSLAAGISPAFTFLMWINESGGSNYEISKQDWGINSSSVVGFNAQLERFLGLPSGYKATYPQCFGTGRTDTQVFFDLFAYGPEGGQCPGVLDPTHFDEHYLNLIDAFWSIFTSCPFTGYPFSSSCY